MQSIFGKRQQTEVVTEGLANIDTGYIDGSSSGLQEILTESSAEMYRHSASYYISDIIMTESVMEGANPEVVMENFVKSAWERLKSLFTKMWAKIRSWYEAAKNQIKLIFLSGEKFVKEFRNKINEKSATGFKYDGYPYSVKDGNDFVNGKRHIISSFLADTVNFNLSEAQREVTDTNRGDEKGAYGQDQVIRGSKTSEKYNETEVKAELRKKLGDEDFSATLKAARKAFHGGKDEHIEISTLDKEGMMKFITENSSSIKGIEESQRQMDSDFKQILSSIEKTKSAIHSSKDTESEKARLTTYATHKYNVAHYGLTLQQGLSSTLAQAYREAGRDFERVLKSFLRFKPAKEGYEGDDIELDDEDTNNNGGNAEDSILESAQRWL